MIEYINDYLKEKWNTMEEEFPERYWSAFNSDGKFVPPLSMSHNDIGRCYSRTVRSGYGSGYIQQIDLVEVPVVH